MIAALTAALIDKTPADALPLRYYGKGRSSPKWPVIRDLQIHLKYVATTDAERYALLSRLTGRTITTSYNLSVAEAIAISHLPFVTLKQEMERINEQQEASRLGL